MKYIGYLLDTTDETNKENKKIKNFIKGCGKNGELQNFSNFLKLNKKFDADKIVVIAGYVRGAEILLQECEKQKIKFIHIDNSYFNSDKHDYFRVVPLATHPYQSLKNVSDKRLSLFNVKIKGWRKDGTHILVIPPSDAIKQVYKRDKWLKKILKGLREYTKRRIIIREKPSLHMWTKKDGLLIKDKIVSRHNVPLKEHLKDCWCVVCDTSTVGLIALMEGIPVICSKKAPMSQICKHDVKDIDDPYMGGDREKLFKQLAYYCYTFDEMKHGLPEKLLSEQGLWIE